MRVLEATGYILRHKTSCKQEVTDKWLLQKEGAGSCSFPRREQGEQHLREMVLSSFKKEHFISTFQTRQPLEPFCTSQKCRTCLQTPSVISVTPGTLGLDMDVARCFFPLPFSVFCLSKKWLSFLKSVLSKV